jgi:gliding motility-associated lipoprotein GldH
MNKILLVLSTAFVLASCGDKTVFDESTVLNASGWNKDSAAVFTVPVEDVNGQYRLLINVRNSGDYKSQNLWLFISYQRPDKSIKKDTVECYLADNRGRWLGSGFGSLYEMPILYQAKMKFTQAGKYRFAIKHGMRDSLLTGINDIGLEVQQLK